VLSHDSKTTGFVVGKSLCWRSGDLWRLCLSVFLRSFDLESASRHWPDLKRKHDMVAFFWKLGNFDFEPYWPIIKCSLKARNINRLCKHIKEESTPPRIVWHTFSTIFYFRTCPYRFHFTDTCKWERYCCAFLAFKWLFWIWCSDIYISYLQ
jgi:hypothetical protein